MAELKKPYEISIWEDELDTSSGYYREKRIAVIGTDTMTSPNKAFSPVLKKNVNGEKSLTFSMAYTYFDPITGLKITNPFIGFLINERKVKLHYQGEWFDFLIKTHEEDSESMVWTFTATDAFVDELSKNGYNIEFSTELDNNQGTAIELGKATLKNTDWEVDEQNSDVLVQKIVEPMIIAKLNQGDTIDALDVESNNIIEGIDSEDTLYIFYSYLSNKEVKNVQFMLEADEEDFIYDDKGSIIGPNYRITSDVTYLTDSEDKVTGFTVGGATVSLCTSIDGEPLYTSNQGYRIVYGPLTTYDPVMERTVNIYETGTDNNKQYVYDYIDYTYTTSNVVTSLVTNGSNFNTYESGSLQGWDNATPTTNTQDGVSKPQLMQLTTYPEIGTSKPLLSLSNLTSLRGFMELKFEGTYTNYKNTYYNSGFRDNSSLINNIVAGQEYVLRLAYATTQGNIRHGNLVPFNAATTDGIRVVVAQWENKTETSGNNKIITKSIIPGTTILDFNGSFVRNDTVVEGGSFNNDYTQYLVDNVPQTPSNNCIYRDGNNVEKVWDSDSSTFVNVDDSKFIHYYLTTTTAKQSLSNEDLTNSLKQVGIFLYINNSNLVNQYIYLADIQLTKCVRYGTNNTDIVTIGNIPEAVSTETHNYYLKPSDTTKKEEVEIYFDLQGVAGKLGCNVSDIKQVYNENCEKILSISEDHSNCFNILQTICETFECWLKLEVERDPDGTGAIKRDASGKQIKKVAFKTYAGKDNFAGFKYGINLKSINRTLTSDEIVTKLIVDNVQSEYTDSGTMTIRDAKSNPSGEAYILNFDYFIQKGLITNEADCRNDLSIFNSTMKLLNQNLNIKRAEANALEMARIKIGSQRTVYTELINAAAEAYNQGLKDFQEATNTTYERYLNSLSNILPAPDSNWHCSSYDQAEGVLTASTSQTIETYIYPAPIHVVEGQTYTLSCYAKSNGYVTSMDMYKYNASVQNIQSKNNMTLSTDWELYTWTFTANATEDVTIRFDNNGSINQGTTATLYVKQPMLLMGNYDLTNSDEVLNIIGKIYTASITINTYSGLLSNIAKEYQELSEKLEGTKDYVITTSYVPTVGENTYTTRINFDGYIENVRFEIYNSENPSNKLEFTTTLNAKSFEGVNNPVYNRLRFISLPNNYKIEGKETYVGVSFNIINGISKIKLVPIHRESGCTSSIQAIQDSKDALEKAFLTKYNSFIKEGTWSSNDYIDSELYYLDAVQVSNTSAMPKVEYSIDVAEVSEIEGLEAYLFDVGDKTYVEDTEFFGWHEADGIKTPAREEVIVSEVEWHLDEPETNIITVQNYKTQFEDLFQRISAAVQTVQYNEAAYAKTTSIIDADGTLNQNVLLASLNNISDKSYYLTSDGSITIDKDCITIRNLTNSSNIVKIDSRGINISNDGGNNWKTALTGAGINAGVIFTGKVNTEEVTILDEGNPSFRWDKYGISAYKKTSDSQPYDLSTFVRFDQYGLYGIKSNSSYVAQSLEDVKEKAHFGITWDGFFIKNSYTGGGSVQITSENDFQIFNADQTEKIKIGALEWTSGNVVTTTPIDGIAPSLYGIRIQNDAGQTVFKTGDDGNITITGTINATGGNFSNLVTVGKNQPNLPYIAIDGTNASMYSSNYQDGAGYGWMINKDGDAVFNNITARGAIKTAVFEYAEIQAVGGIFLFRPSSTIRNAERVIGTDNIRLTLEKPYLFNVGDWCKISNYTNSENEPVATAILSGNGLTHVYQIVSIDVNNSKIVVLGNAYTALTSGTTKVIDNITDLVGGALVDMGNQANGSGKVGTNNYGIGINSSDNVVNLPRRAISLFETIVDEQHEPKVTYNYRGILGTLPIMNSGVDTSIYNAMAGTQGIYTDNMYIGDQSQYIVFYENPQTHKKELRIRANQVVYEVIDPDTHEPTGDWHDINQIETEGVPGPAGQDAVRVEIDSTGGNFFRMGNVTTNLIAHVYKGTTDITSQVQSFDWYRRLPNGDRDTTWVSPSTSNLLSLTPSDVDEKAVFVCEVIF